jgi:DNA-directed RNA polymerase subunit M/transcription elongation factor TFIIS
MNCPLCHSLLKLKKNTQFYDCSTCFALVKDSQFYLSPEEEKKHYEKHNNNVNNIGYQNFTAPVTQFVLQHQKASDKGLDFGSGTGPVISKMLLDKGFTITQYDLYFEPVKERLNSKYDYIVCSEVWEHFQQPKKELIQLSKMLKKNARLIVMTLLYSDEINFETWHYRLDITHVFIYHKKTMEFIAAKFNLELELITDRLIVFKTKIEL